MLTPVVDTLVARTDVDADRCRATASARPVTGCPARSAFEHRLVAAVADPGVVDVSASWTVESQAGMIDDAR